MQELVTFESSGLPASTRVLGFRGVEALSTPYRFEAFLVVPGSEGADLDLGDAIDCKATLRMDRNDGRQPYQFHGILAAVDIVHDTGELTLLRAVLAPRLCRLSLSQNSRMFTNQSIPEILREVFDDAGLPADSYDLRLNGAYSVQEHVCQYHESDLDFVSRWMEREGIHYFFDHEGEREKLIVTDDGSAHPDLASPVRFRALGARDDSGREALHTFRCNRASLPSGVRLKDYDYTKPTLDVTGRAPVSRLGLSEVSVYGGRMFTPEEANRMAKIRAEELQAGEVIFHATGSVLYMHAGAIFDLEEHPRAAFDAKYLIISVEHHANQSAWAAEIAELTGLDDEPNVYRVSISAIPEKVPFRPRRVTAWPRVYGFENAVIDGEQESDYAQIDEHGRYRVRFLFDESNLADGKASTWVRMMQPHGGGIEGWHFPQRKGTEVVVTFLGGDPDCPVISGVVPTTQTPSPVTSANRTKNVIQTGGRNRLEIEDKAGQERITLSTPYANSRVRLGAPNDDHAMTISTEESTLLNAGADFDVTVGADKTEYVLGTTNETYQSGLVTQVWAPRKLVVGGEYTEELLQAAHRRVGGDQTEYVGGSLTQLVAGAVDLTSGPVTQTIHGAAHITASGPYKVSAPTSNFDIKGPWNRNILGVSSDTFIGVKNANQIGGELKITVGASISVKLANELSLTAGASVDLKVGTRVSVTGGLSLGINTGIDVKIGTLAATTNSAAFRKAALACFNSGLVMFE